MLDSNLNKKSGFSYKSGRGVADPSDPGGGTPKGPPPPRSFKSLVFLLPHSLHNFIMKLGTGGKTDPGYSLDP